MSAGSGRAALLGGGRVSRLSETYSWWALILAPSDCATACCKERDWHSVVVQTMAMWEAVSHMDMSFPG